MHIILDTNILRKDFALTGTDFKILFHGYKPLFGRIIIPEVVLDEVITLYREEINDVYNSIKDKRHYLSRILVSGSINKLEEFDVLRESELYKQYLMDVFKKANVTIHPYPEVSHKTIVSRELSRRKPFKRNGSGYRDYLIWETVKKFGAMYGGDVVFITSNSNDFGIAPKPHPDLIQDLSFERAVRIYNSLSSFIEKEIFPQLKIIDDLKKRILEQTEVTFDISDWVSKDLLDLIYFEELGSITVGFPNDVGRIRANQLKKLIDINILDARQLETGEKFVRLSIKAAFNINISINWDDYVKSEEVREWVDDDSPFSSLETDTEQTLTIVADLILERDTNSPVSENLISISGQVGEIDFT